MADRPLSDHVERTFPELDEIGDDNLRAKTVEAWALAMEENDIDDLAQVPWLPPDQERLDLGDEWLVDHVREVATGGRLIAELLDERETVDVDTDVVVAGGLLHDVSKLYEFHGFERTGISTTSATRTTASTSPRASGCRPNSSPSPSTTPRSRTSTPRRSRPPS